MFLEKIKNFNSREVEYSDEISILKGIGIFAVVIGHTSIGILNEMIYYWHLPLFFFVIGMTYNRKKYERNVGQLMGARAQSFFPMYILYMVLLLFLHNPFYKMGILPEGIGPYEGIAFAETFGNYFHLYVESLAGALWFMFPFFWATLIWGIINYITQKVHNENVHAVLNLIMCVIVASVGFFLLRQGFVRWDHLDVALVIMPIVALGAIYKLFYDKLHRVMAPFMILFLIVHFLVAKKTQIWMVLDQRRYDPIWLFYFLSISGIAVWIAVAKILARFEITKKVFGFLGKSSMDIMTLHFVFFKLVDYAYMKIKKPAEWFNIHQFPISVQGVKASIVYIVAGILGPIMVRLALHYIRIGVKKLVLFVSRKVGKTEFLSEE